MWPRTDGTIGPGADMTVSRRTKNAGLSGFVSFMKRKDAERALREFDGFDWGGSVLRVGWSKAVPIAQKPLYGWCIASFDGFCHITLHPLSFRCNQRTESTKS
jgi:U2-associated protein SR140